MNCYVVEQGVHTGVCKRFFGSTTRLEVARLRSYPEPSYPVYDVPDGEIVAYVGRGHVIRVLEKQEEWMEVEMIPNICNFFQKSVLNEEIVYSGWVQKHEEGWWKNWDFEFIEMDTKYKFVKQTEPLHMLVGLHKEPLGEKCMKATKWSVSLVDTQSIHDREGKNGKLYRFGKLKMLPKVGGWTIAGEGFSKKAWSPLKNLESGDDNWTIEAPLKALSEWADQGLDAIAEVVNEMMERRVHMIFAFEKCFNLNHLARKGYTPENTEIEGNLLKLLTETSAGNPKLNHGATVFHVQDGSWKILTMGTDLAISGDRSGKLFSEQHDVVCIVLSNLEVKATFWSLQAKFEATSFADINYILKRI